MDYRKIFTFDPAKRSGKATIRGTRMAVKDVREYLAGGMSEAELFAEFPDLTAEDIGACIAFATDRDSQPADPEAGRKLEGLTLSYGVPFEPAVPAEDWEVLQEGPRAFPHVSPPDE